MSKGPSTDGIVVRPSADVDGARALAVAAGLEVEPGSPAPLALWGAYDGDRLVGVVTLDEDAGLPVIGWIAVAESARGCGLGRRLLATAECEARRRGSDTLFATARAPGFFMAHGYELVGDGYEALRLLAGCHDCPQYGTSCRPQAVRKALGGPSG